jgi:acetaldehyde dehydrogenase (acetylating)
VNAGKVRIGIIGAGGFGLFALQHFTQVEGVELAGMAGTHREAAFAAARRFGVPDLQEVDALLERGDIDLVYIATPPFLHHPQALKALAAGKQVICGKPLAMDLAQADELVALARARHKDLDVSQLVEVTAGLGEPKLHRYGKLLRAMLRDQLAWIRDPTRERVLTEANGRDSLAMACAATRLAGG